MNREEFLSGVKEALGSKIKNWSEHNPKRVYIDMEPGDIPEAFHTLFHDMGCRFNIATGDDTAQGIEIMYHLTPDQWGLIVTLRTVIEDHDKPETGTVTADCPAANFIEREMAELLGVTFTGHPDPRRLLMADDWPEGKYPLRRQR